MKKHPILAFRIAFVKGVVFTILFYEFVLKWSMKFTLIDYTAFALWIVISIVISYILVRKFKLFGGNKNVQKALTWGLILGHLIYLAWKYIFLLIV